MTKFWALQSFSMMSLLWITLAGLLLLFCWVSEMCCALKGTCSDSNYRFCFSIIGLAWLACASIWVLTHLEVQILICDICSEKDWGGKMLPRLVVIRLVTLLWCLTFIPFHCSIKEDDKLIRAEGVDSLSEAELREDCRERGMLGLVSVEEMRQQVSPFHSYNSHFFVIYLSN